MPRLHPIPKVTISGGHLELGTLTAYVSIWFRVFFKSMHMWIYSLSLSFHIFACQASFKASRVETSGFCFMLRREHLPTGDSGNYSCKGPVWLDDLILIIDNPPSHYASQKTGTRLNVLQTAWTTVPFTFKVVSKSGSKPLIHLWIFNVSRIWQVSDTKNRSRRQTPFKHAFAGCKISRLHCQNMSKDLVLWYIDTPSAAPFPAPLVASLQFSRRPVGCSEPTQCRIRFLMTSHHMSAQYHSAQYHEMCCWGRHAQWSRLADTIAAQGKNSTVMNQNAFVRKRPTIVFWVRQLESRSIYLNWILMGLNVWSYPAIPYKPIHIPKLPGLTHRVDMSWLHLQALGDLHQRHFKAGNHLAQGEDEATATDRLREQSKKIWLCASTNSL